MLPDQVTFNTMINGYAQCGRVDDAERVLELMKKKDIEPSTITLNTMMVAYINGGRADAVEQVEQVFSAHMQKRTSIKEQQHIRTQWLPSRRHARYICSRIHRFGLVSTNQTSVPFRF